MGHFVARAKRFATAGLVLSVVAVPSVMSGNAVAAQAGLPAGAPHVRFLTAATVRADGSGAVVQLAVTCPKKQGTFALEISVQQQFSHGLPGVANGYASGPCTGKPAVVTDPVDAGQPPDNASFPQTFGMLAPGPAKAFAFDYCDTGCNIDYEYPAQPVTLSATARLDSLTGSANGVTLTVDPAWRLTHSGHAAAVTFHVTCPVGLQTGLGSALLVSPGSGRHVQDAYESADPQWTCTGRQQTFHATVIPEQPATGTVLHAGFGFADVDVFGAEAWGQVELS